MTGRAHVLARHGYRFADTLAPRIVPIGVSVARVWGALQASAGHGGEDVMIAATALDRNLTVVTRNVSDFAGLGVKLENPFA